MSVPYFKRGLAWDSGLIFWAPRLHMYPSTLPDQGRRSSGVRPCRRIA